MFQNYEEKYDDDYFGISKQEIKEMKDKTKCELIEFVEICLVYGVNTSKITFKQCQDLLNGDLGLPDIRSEERRVG